MYSYLCLVKRMDSSAATKLCQHYELQYCTPDLPIDACLHVYLLALCSPILLSVISQSSQEPSVMWNMSVLSLSLGRIVQMSRGGPISQESLAVSCWESGIHPCVSLKREVERLEIWGEQEFVWHLMVIASGGGSFQLVTLYRLSS